MSTATVAGCFRDKSILITGSTGFLGKMAVEKILRIQPDVKKLYLLVRASDNASAKKRVITEIIGKDLFNVLREEHGPNFDKFVDEKITPMAGDITCEDFGLERFEILKLAQEIDTIINAAATTNFYERYDVALASNALSVKYILQFAKQSYVAGEQKGLLLEKPFKMGETLKQGFDMDIQAEKQLVEKYKSDKLSAKTSAQLEKRAMKELGLKRARNFGWPNTYVLTKAMGEMLLGQLGGDLPVVIVRPSMVLSTIEDPMPGWIEGVRTIDAFIVGYADQIIPCFPLDRKAIIDVIPGDMVINAMLLAIATHWNKQSHVIYHVSSSTENPMPSSTIVESMYRYFSIYPYTTHKGTTEKQKVLLFNRYKYFQTYAFIVYKLPLESTSCDNQLLHMVNWLPCGMFSRHYNKFSREYNRFMLLAKFYAPFTFNKGYFDATNLKRLRIAARKAYRDAHMFNTDPTSINWASYLFNIHIPAVVKCTLEKKTSLPA
ncbi:hypothetical protein EJB05_23035 [Eragrostis curvula]|uniref:Fatty acyl-CoA reductase n=1 Tax=Eragrostis curvula TaxID=38414 RepID=A0A5J9V5Z9_9POAL|nr:hypothetical protein EJB05_23035 [Eragrostis curvula]